MHTYSSELLLRRSCCASIRYDKDHDCGTFFWSSTVVSVGGNAVRTTAKIIGYRSMTYMSFFTNIHMTRCSKSPVKSS